MDISSWLASNGTAYIAYIGNALAVAGILVAVVFYFLQRVPKTLDYAVLNYAPLLPQEAELGQHVSLSVRGQTMDDPYRMTVRLLNSGGRAIMSQDFPEPIEISWLGAEAVVAYVNDPLRAELVQQPNYARGRSAVSVRPLLLNPHEWVDVNFILTGEAAQVSARGSFADQSRDMRSIAGSGLGPDAPARAVSKRLAYQVQIWGSIASLVGLVITLDAWR